MEDQLVVEALVNLLSQGAEAGCEEHRGAAPAPTAARAKVETLAAYSGQVRAETPPLPTEYASITITDSRTKSSTHLRLRSR